MENDRKYYSDLHFLHMLNLQVAEYMNRCWAMENGRKFWNKPEDFEKQQKNPVPACISCICGICKPQTGYDTMLAEN